MTPEAIRAAAIRAYEAGLCVVPPYEDGTKRPDGSWKQWQSKRPSQAQMQAWYGERQGIGLLTGAVSGNLECFEFDDSASQYEPLKQLAAQAGLASLIERIEQGYSERTPGGGIHWFYFCEQIEGNTLRLVSRKAGKLHVLPVHPEVLAHCERLGTEKSGRIFPIGCCLKQVRGQIDRICRAAGIPRFTPQMVRRLAAIQFEKAHPGAGSLLLGHALPGGSRVTFQHYIPVPEILRLASEKLPQPWICVDFQPPF